MSLDQMKWVWMNGGITRWGDAAVNVSAHALHYGTGVFEGLRCYETDDGPAVLHMDAHLDRLYASAALYGMKIPYTQEEIAEAICETVRRNDFKSCYVRPLCYHGGGSLGIRARCPVEVAILAWPWANQLGADGSSTGVRVTVSPWVKFHSSMMPTTAKATGQYLNSRLATNEAISRGYDEALLLNTDGNIAEGAVENIFLVSGGRVRTNDERSSILLGITRSVAIEIARDLGYEVEIGTLRLEDLHAADEAFFTGTATEVTPIREVDGAKIGRGGAPGPITEKIQQAFLGATSGRNQRYAHWLHHVLPQPVGV